MPKPTMQTFKEGVIFEIRKLQTNVTTYGIKLISDAISIKTTS